MAKLYGPKSQAKVSIFDILLYQCSHTHVHVFCGLAGVILEILC